VAFEHLARHQNRCGVRAMLVHPLDECPKSFGLGLLFLNLSFEECPPRGPCLSPHLGHVLKARDLAALAPIVIIYPAMTV
jgi:hypothetical protein